MFFYQLNEVFLLCLVDHLVVHDENGPLIEACKLIDFQVPL